MERGGGGHTDALQPWPATEIFLCASITPSHGGAKTMTKHEELSLSAAVARRQEREFDTFPHRKIG